MAVPDGVPGSEMRFAVRRGLVVVVAVCAIVATLPFLTHLGGGVAAGVVLVLAVLAAAVAERVSRAVAVRGGELVVRRYFRARRVSLATLTQLRAEKVRSGEGTMRSDFTRYHLGDEDGQSLSLWAREVKDGARLARVLAAAAAARNITLDEQTEAMLAFEAGGGLAGIFADVGRLVWNSRKKTTN